MRILRQTFLVACFATVFGVGMASAAVPKELSKGGPDQFKPLKFRLVGPPAGGRVSRSVGVPGDPLTYYAATASGGVWKSADGGITWKPIFDDQPTASIGAIALAPSDPNVIYVGSGEANIRGNVQPGNGIYKSLDAGKTWQHVWKQEGQIGTLIVHPANPNIAYAAVLGHAFGPNPERGVYRTKDGGKTWQLVLFKDPSTGTSDVCFDPSNPNVLFAGLWQARRRPWEFTSGGPGSGLYVSRDAGDTWKQLTEKGLPEGVWGKVGVAVAPSDGRRVYAMIEADEGGLFRSDDGGDKWHRVSSAHYLRQRAWYYTTLTIDPRNPNVVWVPQVHLLRSIDGGESFRQIKGPHHGDHHDVWIDPRNPRRVIDSNDGGVDVTVNAGETWYAPQLPIAQFYHVAADNRTPYHVSGAMQDLGTASGPSNSLSSANITLCEWRHVGGGEAGFTAPDPSDPHVIYAGEYGGYMTRYDDRTRQAQNVSIYPTNPSGHGAEDLRYRFQWTAPILISPHDPKTVYHAGNVVFKTTDGGVHWTPISSDLTRNDRSKQKWSGGPITGDNTGVEYYDTIFAVTESPKEKGVLWAGTDDGLVHVTRDGGKTWSNVTANVPNLPEWATVDCIEASPFDAGTAYVVVDNHRQDDMRPYLFKTSDYGKTWKSLAARLPQDVYLHAVREDPKKRGLLYAGTERGLAFSVDDGATWQPFKLNLPTVAVHDLVVKNDDLVVGTHGRSIWIFDDLTPLREFSPQIAGRDTHLFAPPPAVRWRYHPSFVKKGIGQNPPPGAPVSYYLKKKPKGEIKLEVYDAQGTLVAVMKNTVEVKPVGGTQHRKEEELAPPIPEQAEDDPDATGEKYKKPVLTTEVGVNRVSWDLLYDGATPIPGAKIDAGEPTAGPLVLPGTYALKLTVEGQTQTTTVTVLPDPRVHLSAEQLAEQLKLTLGVRDDITHLSKLVIELQSVRRQLSRRNALLRDNPRAEPLLKSSRDLIDKLDTLEEKLHNPDAEVTYDILAQKGGAQLYSKLGFLYENLKEADGLPPQGVREVYAEQSRELRAYTVEWHRLVSGQLAKLNETARRMDVPNIVMPGEGKAAR